MASIEELRNERIKKVEILKEKGINPYPVYCMRELSIEEVLEGFGKFSKRKKLIILAGRLRAIRKQGGLIFVNIDDGSASIQGMIKKADIGEDVFALFTDTVDIGDFVELKGSLFITKRKEKTIEVRAWNMLAKSVRPLPDKWHGLKDVEERFRKRYLDIMMSSDVKDRFIIRSKIISHIRSFLDKKNFLEVETPILQQHAGGATALPFITHHNALQMDLYLRIAPELYLKRLLVGGFPKVYEIGRNFRNEGIDITHNPEFTMLEFYESYSNAREQMNLVENLVIDVAKHILKKTTLAYGEYKVDFSKKFSQVSYFDLLKRYALIPHPETVMRDELALKARQLGVPFDKGDSIQKIMDNIYKKVCRPKLIQPTFIVDYPLHMLPLAKKKDGEEHVVDAFQLVAGGVEIAKGFSELNDPIDQAERFKIQEKDRKEGDSEAQTSDKDFLEAMEYGMPPSGGVGIGIERLIMIFSDVQNIREVILFPTLRSK